MEISFETESYLLIDIPLFNAVQQLHSHSLPEPLRNQPIYRGEGSEILDRKDTRYRLDLHLELS